MTDIAGLCERLRAVRSQGIRAGKFWNEDGPEAADTLERQAAELANCRQHWSSEFKKLSAESKALADEQAAEIERLRKAAKRLLRAVGASKETPSDEMLDAIWATDAALTGEMT